MARASHNVVNRSSSGGQGPHTRREAGDPRGTGTRVDDPSNNGGGDAMLGAAVMTGTAASASALSGAQSDSMGEYAGPIGMNANPMDGAQVMEGQGEIRKKKKNPMDMGMDYAGPESPSGGFEGMAGNTFSKEGLDKMNEHYAQTQQSMA